MFASTYRTTPLFKPIVALELWLLLLLVIVLMAGCVTPPAGGGAAPSAAQQAVTSTTVSYQALDAAIAAADAAVKSGTLKGQDARNALKGLTEAKAGLDLALLTLRAANAAAAAPGAASAPVSGAKP